MTASVSPDTRHAPLPKARSRAGLGWSAALLALTLFSGSAAAMPFAKGQSATGKGLHDKACVSCHNSMFPKGRGDQVYSPEFRKIKSVAALQSRIEHCANQVNAGWFEEEVEHVGRYLNDQYYRFK